MSLHFLALELPRWDEAAFDALVLTFFRDERPLRGAAGLADWRLVGRLSRLIKGGHMSGAEGEVLLMPPGRRLPFRRILLCGLGRQGKFDDETYRRHVRWIRDVLRRAGVNDFAVQPPGRATGLVAARRALEMWLEEAGSDDGKVAIIDTSAAHKDMADVLQVRQRGRRESAMPPPAGPAGDDAAS